MSYQGVVIGSMPKKASSGVSEAGRGSGSTGGVYATSSMLGLKEKGPYLSSQENGSLGKTRSYGSFEVMPEYSAGQGAGGY